MANEYVVFKKGSSTSLPEEITPGALLVETDTGKMYLDNQSELVVTLSDVKVDAITYELSTETPGSLTGFLQKKYFTEGNFPTSLGQIYYQSSISQFLKVVELNVDEDATLRYLESETIPSTSPQQYKLTDTSRVPLFSTPDQFYDATSSNAQSGKAVAQALEQNIEELSKSLPYKLTGQTKLEQFVQKYQLKQNKYIDLSFIGNEKYFADLTTAVTAINSGNFTGALADETGANIVVFIADGFYVIRMLNDITTSTGITIEKDFIFDFNGKTLTFENGTVFFDYYNEKQVLSKKPSLAVLYGMKRGSSILLHNSSVFVYTVDENNFNFLIIGGNYNLLSDDSETAKSRLMFYFHIPENKVLTTYHEFLYMNIDIQSPTIYTTTKNTLYGINVYMKKPTDESLLEGSFHYVKCKDINVTGNVKCGNFYGLSVAFNYALEYSFVEFENIHVDYTAETVGIVGSAPIDPETADLTFNGIQTFSTFKISNCKSIVQVPQIETQVQMNGVASTTYGSGIIQDSYFIGNWNGVSASCYGGEQISVKNVYAASPDHGGFYSTTGNFNFENCIFERQFISGYHTSGYGSSYFRNYDTSKELNVYINNSKFIGLYPAIALSYDSNNTPNNPYGTNVYVSNTEIYNNQCRVDNNNTLYVGNNVGTITNTVTSNPGTITTTTEDYPYVEPVLPSIPDVILGEQLLDPITVGNFSDMLYGKSYAYLQDNYKYIVDLFSKVIEAEGIDNLFEVGDLVVDDGALK